jgi:hypothetical protein
MPHPHLHLDPKVREEAKRRLLSAKGHLEGIQRMLEDEGVGHPQTDQGRPGGLG